MPRLHGFDTLHLVVKKYLLRKKKFIRKKVKFKGRTTKKKYEFQSEKKSLL